MNTFWSPLILEVIGLFYSQKSSKMHKNCIQSAIKCSCAGCHGKKSYIQYQEKSLITNPSSFFGPHHVLKMNFLGVHPPIVHGEKSKTALFRIRQVVPTFGQRFFFGPQKSSRDEHFFVFGS